MTEQLTDLRYSKLNAWIKAKVELDASKNLAVVEMTLRKEVAALFFPAPKEGVNSANLGDGYELKFNYKLDRKIDEAALPSITTQLAEIGVSGDALIERKPSLNLTAYRYLCETNEQAAKIFEGALTTKPASPSLDLKSPAKPKQT